MLEPSLPKVVGAAALRPDPTRRRSSMLAPVLRAWQTVLRNSPTDLKPCLGSASRLSVTVITGLPADGATCPVGR